MKYTVNTKEFLNVVKNADVYTSRGKRNKKLQNIDLVFENNRIIIRSSNHSEWFEGYVFPTIAEISDSVSLVVNVKSLISVLKNVNIEVIDVFPRDTDLVISWENKEIVLPSIEDDTISFNPPKYKEFGGVTVNAKELAKHLNRVVFAVNPKELRIPLQGVNIELHHDNITFVATDGYRLSYTQLFNPDVFGDSTENVSVLLPKDAVTRLLKLLRKTEEVKIVFCDVYTKIVTSQFQVVITNVMGTFPTWGPIADAARSGNKVIEVKAKVLKEAISLIRSLDSDGGAVMSIARQKVSLSTFDKGGPTLNLDVDIINTREDIKVGFNTKFLLDFLKIVLKENKNAVVKLVMDTPKRALFAQVVDTPEWGYVFMPKEIRNW